MPRKTSKGAIMGALALGLAGGVALGNYVITPNLPGGANFTQDQLTQERDQNRERAEIAESQAGTANSFIDLLAEETLENKLSDRAVLVLASADAFQDDIDAVTERLESAGAVNSGFIKLEEKFFAQDGADALKSIVANTLPAGAQLSTDQLDAGTHAGEALGSALMLDADSNQPQSTTEERAIILRALREADFIDYEDGTILPAQAIVIVTGDKDLANDEYVATAEVNFAKALGEVGAGVVVTGRIHTAADTGVVGRLRANDVARETVSTVDSVDTVVGQVASVLAVKEQLDGESGAYGSAASADAASPTP